MSDLFEALRLPRPGGISQELSRLKDVGYVVRRRAGGSWSLTPEGREQLGALIRGLDVQQLEAEIATSGSAELSNVQHPLIPPEFAPIRWAGAVQRLLARYPFESNVFCMTRFPSREPDPADPITEIISTVRSTLGEHGLTMHLASDRNAEDELFGNVAAHIWACKYGIGLFESRVDPTLNDNVLIEVGSMLVTGRRCALVKDQAAPGLPTDFVGHIYKSANFDDSLSIRRVVADWVNEDLGLPRLG